MRGRLSRRTLLTAGLVFLVFPALVILGVRVWDGRKYFLVSLAVVTLALVPFFIRFEKKKPQARELVLLATMTALAVAGRVLFAWFPQIKPVCAIVILTAAAFDPEAGFIVGAATALISNFFFGQGPWTPWQTLGLGLVGFVAGLLFSGREVKRWALMLYGFLSVLILYGLLMDTASLFTFGSVVTREALLTTLAAGLSFNLVHAASTAVFLFLLEKPLRRKLARVKIKYGLLE